MEVWHYALADEEEQGFVAYVGLSPTRGLACPRCGEACHYSAAYNEYGCTDAACAWREGEALPRLSTC